MTAIYPQTVPNRAMTASTVGSRPSAVQPRPNGGIRRYTKQQDAPLSPFTIDSEVAWALDRLCRLCNNEQFVLRAIPGLTNALHEWPEWYIRTGAKELAQTTALFSLSPEQERKRRHALESLFILRNAAVNEPNAAELAAHLPTRHMILCALHTLEPDSDANTEFLLYVIELLHSIAGTAVLPPPDAPVEASPLLPLQNIARHSSNRTLMIASLATLTTMLSNPANMVHLTPDSPALEISIRVLPLILDRLLVDTALNYIYAHLSYPPMMKAFLLHPDMQGDGFFDIGAPVYTVPAQMVSSMDHELTKEELDNLVPMPEPQRCYEWMRTMFVSKPDGELTQVDFWNLYRDAFTPFQDRYTLLVASDVIKNVSVVFPQAQAMVLPGPPQRFIVRGVDRRKENPTNEAYKCQWDRSECSANSFVSTGDLYEHVLQDHINTHEDPELSCLWASCSHPSHSKSQMRAHVLTHLPSMQPTPRHPLQSDTITLPAVGYPHPISDPTTRPPPPLRSAKVTYLRPVIDPPSGSLTALLCIRLMFRASFASSDAAPRVDENHFGFPGIVEESDEQENAEERSRGTESEKEGERRGRKAFIGVRHMLEEVRIRDETLMSWIPEMVDAGLSGTT
ncbi:Chromatin structure-remodeling complex subunit rsc9 [Grifola frondosa]|uniref:Chromatin structure-remodeling complex subunit rsc9 n=1 Tax=Grifola frondosa TaxID=5627 RepID=A0A1C7MRV2_GRIFR|nr:Chromatin structure-remodeling complex subunit rsc9 [Grifola frondosa]